jgi:hypothetical protein
MLIAHYVLGSEQSVTHTINKSTLDVISGAYHYAEAATNTFNIFSSSKIKPA